ncbi:MAG TPA: PHP domain-containing protein, partial [Firmicutes bacterium]|nr:PHP domain-containing protein [Bacillota bacterium]
MSIDLHLHTQASDGTLTPKELLAKAKKYGLMAVSITDHDVIDSLQEGVAIAANLGLTFIPGVEISASYTADLSLHILGYGIDPQNPKLRKVLRQNQQAWEQSEEDSIAALEKINIKIDRLRYNYWKTHSEMGGWPLF